jgi:hypothetical protein
MAQAEGDLQQRQRHQDLDRLYQGYMQRTSSDEGRKQYLFSDYARTSRDEYVAEGVSWYMQGDEQRRELETKDPGLYSYVRTLVNEK